MTVNDFRNFECDRCGACCAALIVEPTYADGLREPKLVELLPKSGDNWRNEWRNAEIAPQMRDADMQHCRFCSLNKDGLATCEIYPTRPDQCVAVEAGDAKCQQAREAKGLPILRDKFGDIPTREAMEASCEWYSKAWTPFCELYDEEAE